MDIRYKLYPYPVLAAGTDDYVNSQYSFDINYKKGVRELIFEFDITLINKGIQEMVDDGKAEFLIHLECPQTCYRSVVKFQDKHYEKHILESQLNGKLSICAFIVAKQDLKGYTNTEFNEDYGKSSFNIERGSVLGIGGQYNLDITKDTEELEKVPSIFSICRAVVDDGHNDMKINLDGDKIAITLCNESFQNYKLLSAMPDFLPVFHSMLIVPALIYVFETLRREDIEEHEDKRWFKGIKKTLKKYEMTLDQELLEQYPSYELAQKLLDAPINKALNTIIQVGEVEEE